MVNEEKQRRELNSVTKKILLILGLTLALIVPLSQVEEQISSRREYESVAQKEVAKGWGENVSFSSPFISAFETSGYPSNAYPTSSDTTIELDSKEKKRGIFRVPVYLATLKTKVIFDKPTPQKSETPKGKKSTEMDHLILEVSPISSIQSFRVKELTSGKELRARLIESGIRLAIDELPNKDVAANQLEFEIAVRGTGSVTYRSNSDQDKIKMVGNWTKPKFVGEVLPTETKLASKGFEASWTLNALPKWDSGSRESKSIGLTHLWISTDYTMIERSIKYGILFIVLTFLLVFIVEFMSKARIHPLQYGLIGLSITVFYVLILAFSETMGFDIAYLTSSVAVTGLIGFYLHGFINQKRFVRIILIEQITLSAFFYVLLSFEERAFLIGSLGLFTALAIIMILTRRFDWYAGSFKPKVANQAQ